MTYEQLTQQYGMPDFLSGDTVIQSATRETNINGDGRLSLSWRSTEGGAIKAGTVLGDYVMMETYTPTLNSDGTYSYSPSFTHKDALAAKIIVSLQMPAIDPVTNAETTVTLYTFPYTGYASQLIQQMSGYGWQVVLGVPDAIISVSIDGDSVKSLAQKIASALGTDAYFTGGKIQIGGTNAYAADAYYNKFVVLGGTRNMGKKTLKGTYAVVTQRLTLDEGNGVGSGSVIDVSNGEPPMMKILVNDDIYPKMDLEVTAVYFRRCYLLNESGEKIAEDPEAEVPSYKQYTKWYIELGRKVGNNMTPYTIPRVDVLENKPMSIMFQSGALAGRQFEVADFASDTYEKMDDDVSPSGFTAPAGSYRIVMVADGSILLPANNGLIPSVGDRVTPMNLKMDASCVTAAKTQLREWADGMIALYHNSKPPQFQAQRSWSDFLTGGPNVPEIGTEVADTAGYIVTSVSTDLLTGASTVTYGTFKAKGLVSSIVDKVEGVQLSGGSASVAGAVGSSSEADYRATAPIGIDQYNLLRQAGGALGMKTVNRRISDLGDSIETLGTDVQSVKQQADSQFNIYFGTGAPTTSNYPASSWTTESDKALHEQDIYYDTQRTPASTGGRAWRWLKVGNVWQWQEITDADTIASLEKIADVASDGILSAGMEKVRILGDWTEALNEYTECLAAETTYGTSTAFTQMKAAFVALGTMLNGNEALTTLNGIPTETPEFIADLTERTRLADYSYTDGEDVEHSMDADYYRSKWDAWYEKLAALKFAITGQVNTEAKSKMQFFVSSPQTADYKIGDMWRDNGTNYICIATTNKGTANWQNDWQEVGASEDTFSSITNLLSELTILIAEIVKAAIAYYEQPGRTNRNIRLYLAQTMPLDAVTKELWFDGTNLKQYDGTDWNAFDPLTDTSISDAIGLLTRIVAMIGYGETITFHREMSSQGANLYDVYFRKATFFDKFSQKTFEGGLGIWIYGRYGWEHIIDNTTGLLENYGDHIVNAVFGDSTLANLHVRNFASAMMTSKNALELFSRMMSNGKTMAEALFALGVDVKYYVDIKVDNQTTTYQVEKDGNGWKYSAGQAVSGAYTGSPLDIYAVGESNAKLSADRIDLIGKTVINGKFIVDNNGNVTMANATIDGAFKTTGDRIMIYNGTESSQFGTYDIDKSRIVLNSKPSASGAQGTIELLSEWVNAGGRSARIKCGFCGMTDVGFFVYDSSASEADYMVDGDSGTFEAEDSTVKVLGGLVVGIQAKQQTLYTGTIQLEDYDIYVTDGKITNVVAAT